VLGKLFADSDPDRIPLSHRVALGGVWIFALRFFSKGLGFIRTIILARILSPEDFGLFGVAMLSIATIETLSQTGFQTALVQKKENIESYLNTAWTVSIFRGIILFLILFASAPFVADFFNSNESIWAVRILSVSCLLNGFRNIHTVYFNKELEMNKQFLLEITSTLSDLCVALTLAFALRSVWALILAGLAGNFMQLLMSYIIAPRRPQIHFDKQKFCELFSFGKWVISSGVLVFLITQGDDIFVGKIFGVTALGLYQMAYLLSNLPATEIAHVVSQVSFPAYAKMQNNLPKLREAYLKVLQLIALISIFLSGGIFIFADDFTQFVLGDKWLSVVPLIQILVFAGLMRSIAAASGPLFLALGKPNVNTYLHFIRFLIIAGLIYPVSAKYGMEGISIVIVLSILISNIGFGVLAARITECRISDYCKRIVLPLVVGLLCAFLTLWLRSLMKAGFFELGVLVLVWTASYVGLTCVFDKLCKSKVHDLMLLILEPFQQSKIDSI
jgi:O-antigen/teichoic acid export membrane protein